MLTASQHLKVQSVVQRHFSKEEDAAYIFGEIELLLNEKAEAIKDEASSINSLFTNAQKRSKQKLYNHLKIKEQDAQFIFIIFILLMLQGGLHNCISIILYECGSSAII